ncbi:MAG: RNB domain-containing ribonuclease [Polyangiaceae bacterium]
MNDRASHAQFDLKAAARRAMSDEGFHATFAPEVLARAEALQDPRDEPGVEDLRHLPWSSIDNHESRDLDQIEVAERLDGGRVRVLVGIADVDAFVRQGDAIDAHAAHNTTSVYAGTIVFPMLPEVLSNDLTSLLEGEDRLAVVTELIVDRDGGVSGERMFCARVRNHAKLVYEDVAHWLDGSGAAPAAIERGATLEAQVLMQDEVARRLRASRIRAGALELETTEARPVTRGDRVVDLKVVERSRARELIEELMIAANGATARWLDGHRRSGLRRVVRTPKRWDRIIALAASFGTTLPIEPDARALSAFMNARRVADPDHMADLSLAVVKLLGPGEYALDRPGEAMGHFGLAVPDYAHSTAPNRRFSDLVTQRIAKAALRGAPAPYDDDALAAHAARCTDREHAAQKVERTMRKIAAALFLSDRIGETYDAVVTGVNAKGTFVRLIAPPAEGRVVQGEAGLDVGDRVRVRLLATEPSRGFIDFGVA